MVLGYVANNLISGTILHKANRNRKLHLNNMLTGEYRPGGGGGDNGGLYNPELFSLSQGEGDGDEHLSGVCVSKEVGTPFI